MGRFGITVLMAAVFLDICYLYMSGCKYGKVVIESWSLDIQP